MRKMGWFLMESDNRQEEKMREGGNYISTFWNVYAYTMTFYLKCVDHKKKMFKWPKT